MRLTTAIFLSILLLASGGCSTGGSRPDMGAAAPAEQTAAPNKQEAPTGAGTAGRARPESPGDQATFKTVSLSQADASQAAPAAVERKIIRNASLTVEVEAPAEGQRRISSVAAARDGFVVTSESRQQGGYDGVKPFEIITLEIRVPAAQFDAVIDEIRGMGSRVTEEKITGQDVTEEYIDLEARIRAQKALEAQFLEIMKRASKVSDALEVQRELTNVRTEIERIEGRRRFLESQTSLSTIKVTLRPPAPLVSTSGFFQSIGRAFGDGVDVAASITLWLIRVILALLPLLLIVVLPLALLLRFLIRRARRRRPPAPAVPTQTQAAP